MPDQPNNAFSKVVDFLESRRKAQQDVEDKAIDSKIALIHDLISAPGANPARTAEGLANLMELYGQKGGKTKAKKGAGPWGEHEMPEPSLLAGIIHGSIPFQGPTTEPVPQPQSPAEQGLMPEASAILPGLTRSIGSAPDPSTAARSEGFTGKSALNSPVMIPPEPLQAAPEASRMLSAARDMQKYNEGPKTRPLPQEQQPMMRSPEEMAQMAGETAAIKTSATRDAEHDSDIKYWRSVGFSDGEIREMLKRKAMGTQGQMQDADAGFWTVDGKTVRAVRIFNPMTGQTSTVDAITRLPLPPNAQPAAAPSNASQGQDPTSYKEYEKYVADEQARGNTKVLSYDNWLTMDANRKRPNNTTNIHVAGTDMTANDRTAFNQIVSRFQLSPLMKAKDRTVTLMANIGAVEKDPSNAAAQLALGYSFVQALDTYQSAVREGELKNLTLIDSKLGNLQLWAQQMLTGKIQRPEVAMQIAQSAKLLSLAIANGATAKQRQFKSQAQVNGLGKQWDEYVAGFSGSPDAGGGNASGGAKVGDKKVAANGKVLYFDGTGWGTEPVVPAPPR